VRRDGARASVERALERVARPELDGFWVHVDVDVLDDEVMPAVDYRLPGGLAWDELGTVLASAAGTGRMSGLDLAIFNPALDADGSIAARLADTLADALLDGARA
jgi:arginase